MARYLGFQFPRYGKVYLNGLPVDYVRRDRIKFQFPRYGKVYLNVDSEHLYDVLCQVSIPSLREGVSKQCFITFDGFVYDEFQFPRYGKVYLNG